jgi:hypothetical protein
VREGSEGGRGVRREREEGGERREGEERGERERREERGRGERESGAHTSRAGARAAERERNNSPFPRFLIPAWGATRARIFMRKLCKKIF